MEKDTNERIGAGPATFFEFFKCPAFQLPTITV